MIVISADGDRSSVVASVEVGSSPPSKVWILAVWSQADGQWVGLFHSANREGVADAVERFTRFVGWPHRLVEADDSAAGIEAALDAVARPPLSGLSRHMADAAEDDRFLDGLFHKGS